MFLNICKISAYVSYKNDSYKKTCSQQNKKKSYVPLNNRGGISRIIQMVVLPMKALQVYNNTNNKVRGII